MAFLTESMVNVVYQYCILGQDEVDVFQEMVVGGLGTYVIFHGERIGQSSDTIRDMLAQLPDSFRTETGDRLKNACITRTGERWAADEYTWEAEKLFQLGIASDLVQCESPYEPWGEFPLFRVLA